jgi:hypothetical protein
LTFVAVRRLKLLCMVKYSDALADERRAKTPSESTAGHSDFPSNASTLLLHGSKIDAPKKIPQPVP